jgi:hypothetical protein
MILEQLTQNRNARTQATQMEKAFFIALDKVRYPAVHTFLDYM